MGARFVGFFLLAVVLAGCGADGEGTGRERDAAPAETGTPARQGPPCPAEQVCRGAPARTGAFDADALAEASGMVASRRASNLLWLIDDREGADRLWALRPDGTVVATPLVPGMDAVNAEALAAGPCGADDPTPCLFVGDIGDNVGGREHIRVLRLPEPDLAGDTTRTEPAQVVELRYPDGPRDAEALLVDRDGVPYVVSKASFDAGTGRTGPTRLYAAPGFRDGLLLDLGEVVLPEPTTPVVSLLYGNTVTGGDSVAGRVLLRTYDQIVEFTAPTADADLSTLATWPARRVTTPWLPQSEAVAYAADGCGYWSVSEGAGDIWLVPCEPDGDGTGQATKREGT